MTEYIAQPHTNRKTPAKTERNALVRRLRKQGLTYPQIARHPEVIKLSDNAILTKGRISQILKTKGGES